MKRKKMTPKQSALLELECAERALDAAKVKCTTAAVAATVAFQRALMRLCDASDAVRRVGGKQ